MPLKNRIENIDLLRGIVMIIMALDHTRDFIHSEAFTDDPLNLQTTTPFLFFTRWITHLCAPTFVFLSGTSIYFQTLRKTIPELASFLLKRGAWLLIAEVTLITLAITFDLTYSVFVLQVIWAIGISMVLLGLIIRLPFYVIFSIGIIIFFGHNLLDYYEARQGGNFPVWYHLLHRQGIFTIGSSKSVYLLYPMLPWVGVMIMGYCFGRYYLYDVMTRHKRTIWLGAGLLLLFIILRAVDVYGDPLKWAEQKNSLYTFLSFINIQKYPPSLLYCCVTLGVSLLVLGISGESKNRLTSIVSIYGRVPLFYYILHFYLIHLISAVLFLARGHTIEEGLTGESGLPFKFLYAGEGYSLAIVYLVWVFVVVVLYPLCKRYAAYKAQHRKWWLSYL